MSSKTPKIKDWRKEYKIHREDKYCCAYTKIEKPMKSYIKYKQLRKYLKNCICIKEKNEEDGNICYRNIK